MHRTDAPPKPNTWQVEPEAYLGRDEQGRDYWLIRTIDDNGQRTKFANVVRHYDGHTTWISTYAAWELGSKIYGVKMPA